MKGFTVLPEVSSMIAELTLAGDTSSAWREPHGSNWNPYVNMNDKRVVLIEDICGKVATELRKQGLTSLNDDFLEPYAWDIMARIDDPVLKSMHVMEG